MFILCCVTHSDWFVNSMSIWPAYLAEVSDMRVRQIKISSEMASGVLLGRVWYGSRHANLFFFSSLRYRCISCVGGLKLKGFLPTHAAKPTVVF